MKHLWRVTLMGLFFASVVWAQTPTPPAQTAPTLPCSADLQPICDAVVSYGVWGVLGLIVAMLAWAYFSGWLERMKKRGEEDAQAIIPNRTSLPTDPFNEITHSYLEAFSKYYSRFSFQGLGDIGGSRTPIFNESYITLFLSSNKITLTDAVKGGKCLAILGAAGFGKSTLLQWAGVTVARAQLRGQPTREQREFTDIVGQPIPIFISLRDFVNHCHRAEIDISPSNFVVFCQHFYQDRFPSINFPIDFFERHLRSSCLLLLDGVDEVAPGDRLAVRTTVEGLLASYGTEKVRYLLSSRAVAYRGEVEFADFERLEIQLLSIEQRDALMGFWCEVVYPQDEAARNVTELIQSINSSDERVRELARTPLMVAIFVLVYYHNSRQLPRQRAEFYHRAVHILAREAHHTNVSEYPTWTELPVDTRIDYIKRIAWELFFRKLEDATCEELIDWIGDEFSRDTPRVRAFLDAAVNRSGVLEERNGQIGFFTHRTFQEYLAGLYLAQALENRWEAELREYFLDDTWWEVLQLAAGALAYLAPSKANNFIYILSNLGLTDSQKASALERAALAQADFPADRAQAHRATLVQRCMTGLVDMTLPAKTRRTLGLALAKLGDPRIMPDPQGNQFVSPVWCNILGGQSRNGVNASDHQIIKGTISHGPDPFEKPSHTITLSGFYLAKYPVSNAEYSFFVESDNYSDQAYWGEDGWKWLNGEYDAEYLATNPGTLPSWLLHRPIEKRRKPALWDDPQWNLANLPVVGITWFEAVAYCNWLNDKLKGQLPVSWSVRLPTEAEWEKACRRTKIESGELKKDAIWPWGNFWSENRCNTDESNIGYTNPFGMYPLGISADGVEDLIGNVSEWCLDGRDEDAYKTRNGATDPFVARGKERVLRGGNFRYDRWDSYATKRDWNIPAIYSDHYGFRVCVSPISHIVNPGDHI